MPGDRHALAAPKGRRNTMDETDLRLLNALIQDSRTSYAVLARRLKLSIPAVHKRVATLLETGVITKFTANLSVGFLRAVPVYLSGVSQAFHVRDATKALRGSDRTSIIVRGSGNSVYVRAILPTIQDLDSYVAFFQKAAAVASLAIGIEAVAVYGSAPPPHAPLLASASLARASSTRSPGCMSRGPTGTGPRSERPPALR